MKHVSIEDHVRLDFCKRPRPSRRWEARLWVCPICHQAFVATIRPNPRYAPGGLSWNWVLWTPGAGPSEWVS